MRIFASYPFLVRSVHSIAPLARFKGDTTPFLRSGIERLILGKMRGGDSSGGPRWALHQTQIAKMNSADNE
jgi:hypothetical protein